MQYRLCPHRLFLLLWAVMWGAGLLYFQPNSGGSGLELPFNSVFWLLSTGLIATMALRVIQCQRLQLSRFSLWFLLAIGLMCLPYVYPNNALAEHTLSRLLGLLAGWLFYVALLQLPRPTQARAKLLTWVMLAVTLQALLCLVQYYLLEPGNWLGYNTLENRPYGIFQQPNVTASFLATGCALSLYLLQTAHGHWRRCWLLFTALAAALVITLLQSRAGYIGLALVAVLGWFGARHVSPEKTPLRVLWLAALAVGVIVGLATFSLAESVARSGEVLANPGARVPMFLRSIEMMLERPLLGWGYGSFESQFLAHQSAAYVQDQTIGFGAPNLHHPHNELLYWGVEGGLVPVAAILGLAVVFCLSLRRQRSALLWLALLAPLAVHSMREYPFYHAASHWLLFLLLLWLADSERQDPIEIRLTQTFALRVLTPLLTVAVWAFMATNLHTVALQYRFEHIDRDTSVFSQVINPLGIGQRLEFNLMAARLQIGLQTGDQRQLAAYSDWAREFTRSTPRAEIYALWYDALRAQGLEPQAAQVDQQGRFLYPRRWDELVSRRAAAG